MSSISGKKNDNTKLLFLDGLRGITALIVMIGHARWLLWEGYSEGYLKHPGNYSFLSKIFVYGLSVFKYGHQAVLFFFILSGFVIHLKYSRSIQRDASTGFDWRNYFFRRIKRIYPPFLFIVAITFLLDRLGMRLGYSIYMNQTPNALLNANIAVDHSFINLLGNLFFLQGGPVGIWGTNSPLWSLKFEWWFYIIYPVLFFMSRYSTRLVNGVVPAVFIIAYFSPAALLPDFVRSVLEYLLYWWMGAVLADIYTGRIRLPFIYPACLVLLLPVMAVMGERVKSAVLSDGLWALGVMGFLSLLFYIQERGYRFKILPRLKWLGDCSYTLYILHFPILVFINGVILHASGNIMPQSLVFVLLGVPLLVAISWVVHLFIEKPFVSNRQKFVMPEKQDKRVYENN